MLGEAEEPQPEPKERTIDSFEVAWGVWTHWIGMKMFEDIK
jgi:hypothetical protein